MRHGSTWEFELPHSSHVPQSNPVGIVGDDAGAPSDSGVAAVLAAVNQLDSLLSQATNELFETYCEYLHSEQAKPSLQPDGFWDSGSLLSIGYLGGQLELTFRFSWQASSDDHEVCLRFENGSFAGFSVDG